MKSRKEKENKEQKKKWKFNYIWYFNGYSLFPKWYKVYKWIIYILGSVCIFWGIILLARDIAYQGFSSEKLPLIIVLILVGVSFIFILSKNPLEYMKYFYGESTIEELMKLQEQNKLKSNSKK